MRRPVVLLGLGLWAALTVATSVCTVLWLTEDDDWDATDAVAVNEAVWDKRIAELREFESEHGSVWTVDAMRPKVYADVAIAGLSVDPAGAPSVVTLADTERRPCAPGQERIQDRRVLTICPDGPDGDLSASVDPDEPESRTTEGLALVTVSQWRELPGATDARVDLPVEVPLPADPTPEALRETLGRAVELAKPRLTALETQQVDLASPQWDNYGFMLDLAAWDAQPAPVVED